MGNGDVECGPAVSAYVWSFHGGNAARLQPFLHRPGGRQGVDVPAPRHRHGLGLRYRVPGRWQTDSGWEGRALIDAFLHRLAESVKDELLTRDLPDDLDRIVAMAIRIDGRLEDRRRAARARCPPQQRQPPR